MSGLAAMRGPDGGMPVIRLLLIALVLASGLFIAFPAIDIAVTGLFHNPDKGFWLWGHPVLEFLRNLATWVAGGVLAAAVAVLILALCGREDLLPGFATARAALYLIATAALAPGLIVNGVLKSFWGRARPIHTDLFDGGNSFTLPWVVADGCERNCSFASGEAAFMFWLLALVPLFPAGRRLAAALVLGAFAAAMSSLRIMVGGHYLSDVVIAALITLLVVAALYRLFYGPRTGPRLDRALARIGRPPASQKKA